MMDDAELRSLADDIRVNGLIESIKVWGVGGLIIDGRNRLAACKLAGVAPRREAVDDTTDPVAYILSLNLHRRHLTTSQRASVAARIANLKAGGDRKSDDFKPSKDGLKNITTAAAAKMLNVSKPIVERARRVHRECSPDVVDAIDRGETTVGKELSNLKDETTRMDPSPPQQPKRPRAEMGRQHSRLAVRQLKEVAKSDKFRREGWRLVIRWIASQHKGQDTINEFTTGGN